MSNFSPIQTVPIRFGLDIELYAFALFIAPHQGYGSAESYIADRLASAMDQVTGEPSGTMPFTAPADNADAFRTEDRGIVNVSIPVRENHHDHARHHFAADGFFSPADYLHGTLNAALMEAMSAYQDRPATGTDWRPLWLREYLASRGTEWDGDYPPAMAGDLDADIPF